MIIKKIRLKLNQLTKFENYIFMVMGKNTPEFILEDLGIVTKKNRHSFKILEHLTKQSINIEGDIAECGVYQGGTLLGIKLVLNSLGSNKKIFGFDSFEGLPNPSDNDKIENKHPREALKGFFSDCSFLKLNTKINDLNLISIKLVKGYFSDTLSNYDEYKFSLVHLDCDLYDSYKECLNFFYDRVSEGGFIVFDEYDYSQDVYPGAKKAIDEFLAKKEIPINRLYGRCFIQKS